MGAGMTFWRGQKGGKHGKAKTLIKNGKDLLKGRVKPLSSPPSEGGEYFLLSKKFNFQLIECPTPNYIPIIAGEKKE